MPNYEGMRVWPTQAVQVLHNGRRIYPLDTNAKIERLLQKRYWKFEELVRYVPGSEGGLDFSDVWIKAEVRSEEE